MSEASPSSTAMLDTTTPSTLDPTVPAPALTPTPTIFCCDAAVPVHTETPAKLYKDPNRELHEAIFQSFVGFAVKLQREADQELDIQALLQEVTGAGAGVPAPGAPKAINPSFPLTLQAPIYDPFPQKNNPLTERKAYVIHLTSRHDFGPVYSHRYLMCPTDLKDDWTELTLMQWWETGKPFDLKAEQWDLKCAHHSKFFRITLRPNLNLRDCPPVHIPLPTPALASNIGKKSPPPDYVNVSTPGLAGSLDGAIQTPGSEHARVATGHLVVGNSGGTPSPSHAKSTTPLLGSALPFQPARIPEAAGYFDQAHSQASGLQARAFGGGHAAQGYRYTGIPESRGCGGYLAHPYQAPSNPEAGYFGGRYPAQGGITQYGGLSTGLRRHAYGHAGIPEGGGCDTEYATEKYARFGGQDGGEYEDYEGYEEHWHPTHFEGQFAGLQRETSKA